MLNIWKHHRRLIEFRHDQLTRKIGQTLSVIFPTHISRPHLSSLGVSGWIPPGHKCQYVLRPTLRLFSHVWPLGETTGKDNRMTWRSVHFYNRFTVQRFHFFTPNTVLLTNFSMETIKNIISLLVQKHILPMRHTWNKGVAGRWIYFVERGVFERVIKTIAISVDYWPERRNFSWNGGQLAEVSISLPELLSFCWNRDWL